MKKLLAGEKNRTKKNATKKMTTPMPMGRKQKKWMGLYMTHVSYPRVCSTINTNLFRRNYQKLRTSHQRFQPFSHFFFTAINLLIFGYDAFAVDVRRHFRIRVIYQKKMDGKWV